MAGSASPLGSSSEQIRESARHIWGAGDLAAKVGLAGIGLTMIGLSPFSGGFILGAIATAGALYAASAATRAIASVQAGREDALGAALDKLKDGADPAAVHASLGGSLLKKIHQWRDERMAPERAPENIQHTAPKAP